MGYCGEKDWNEDKNELTWKLFAAGYTVGNYPEEVRWDAGRYEFEYEPSFIRKTVLESPCGLLMKGDFWYGYMSYMGIDWRIENNNSVHPCPYRKVDCKLNHEYLRRAIGYKHNIVQCAFRFSNKVYDYENSYEKVWDEFYAMQERKRKEFYGRLKWNPEARHCNCIRWDDEKQDWCAKYDPWDCVYGCYVGGICVLTGKRLDGKRGNVFYDVKITRIHHDGSLFDGEKVISITKGKKMFDSPKPMAICEAYAKLCRHWILDREKSRFHQELFLNPDTEIEILNVRAEQRETRDLLQDLRDAREGIEVVHESDLIKAKKEAKRERRAKAREKRIKRLWKQYENGDELARKLLIRKGLLDGEEPEGWIPKNIAAKKPEVKHEYEQISLFNTEGVR